MSVHVIYYKDGAKMMRPVLTREEYLKMRGSSQQKAVLQAVRAGDEKQKSRLLQMNYSCLPNADGSLRGAKTMSTTVGMDIDHVPAPQMQPLRERILQKKDELGLQMLELSARKEGYHLVFTRRPGLTQEQNLRWASQLLGVDFDKGAKDITRVFFTTTDSPDDLLYLDDRLFASPNPSEGGEPSAAAVPSVAPVAVVPPLSRGVKTGVETGAETAAPVSAPSLAAFDLCARQAGLNPEAMDVWGEHNWHTNLMAVLSVGVAKLMSRPQLQAVVAARLPNYAQTDDCRKLIDFFYEKYAADKGFMNASLREINARVQQPAVPYDAFDEDTTPESAEQPLLHKNLARLPQGIRDSVEAAGPTLAMPALTAVCPCIGALATGVTLDVHGQMKGLNLIAYIVGDSASGKGKIDPLVAAWMGELKILDKMYQRQEDEYRIKKRAAKNKKDQPEEPLLPVRCLTLNNTVANLAERLANTQEKHAYSFTPEADTVAQKWKSSISDFSLMLRQSYDGSSYEREARSADAVNVHIDHLLWNVTLCGTPDALYRVVNNYTDGFQSRVAVSRTPDNTYSRLEDTLAVLTPRQRERIQQVAHLLPLMQGEVVLPRLEAKGREWVERIRIETMMNDDRVRARQRFRVCVTAQRMTCCIMLCKVCETLIQKYTLSGAENRLRQHPSLWKEMLLRTQTPQMLEIYDIIADSLLENALYFFRERIENAFNSRNYIGSGNMERSRRGRNDSIYERLDQQFTYEQAMQHTVAVKGAGVSHNSVRQMLKNWKKQGLIVLTDDGKYRKGH